MLTSNPTQVVLYNPDCTFHGSISNVPTGSGTAVPYGWGGTYIASGATNETLYDDSPDYAALIERRSPSLGILSGGFSGINSAGKVSLPPNNSGAYSLNGTNVEFVPWPAPVPGTVTVRGQESASRDTYQITGSPRTYTNLTTGLSEVLISYTNLFDVQSEGDIACLAGMWGSLFSNFSIGVAVAKSGELRWADSEETGSAAKCGVSESHCCVVFNNRVVIGEIESMFSNPQPGLPTPPIGDRLILNAFGAIVGAIRDVNITGDRVAVICSGSLVSMPLSQGPWTPTKNSMNYYANAGYVASPTYNYQYTAAQLAAAVGWSYNDPQIVSVCRIDGGDWAAVLVFGGGDGRWAMLRINPDSGSIVSYARYHQGAPSPIFWDGKYIFAYAGRPVYNV